MKQVLNTLKTIQPPRMVREALALYGTLEDTSSKSNPVILNWAKEVGGDVSWYNNDSIPWCLEKETLVHTLEGYKFIKDVTENDFVLTNEGNICKVNKILSREKYLHKLYITGALPISITDDHKILVKKIKKYNDKSKFRIYEEDLKWISVKDLEKGDLLCRKKLDLKVNSELDSKSKAFIFLLGTYAAEGTFRKKVTGNSKESIKARSEAIYLGIGKHEEEKISNLILESGIVGITKTTRRTHIQIEIRDKEFIQFCKDIGSPGLNKQIPYYILHGTDHVKFSFLEGYLNGDGSYNKQTKKGSISSISKKLIIGAGKLLLDKGIFPSYRKQLRAGKSFIEGREVTIKDIYRIQFVDKPKRIKRYLEDENYYYLPIRKIDRNYKVDIVYDLEIDENSNFIANDIVVHNCGLLMSVVAKRADKPVPREALRAKAWDKFGTKVDEAILGDVLIFNRKGGGHVGLYVGETEDSYYVLGGNQSDKVSITRIAKSRIYSIQRPEYKIGMPESCKKYVYTAEGTLSENEA